jgi:hypothetical protein
MSRWAYAALQKMNDEKLTGPNGEVGSLVPPENELDLFVTTTDTAGYKRTLELYDPEATHDLEHRHVLHFRFDAEEKVGDRTRNDFTAAYDRALTLAIRCTSSFPGAFPRLRREKSTPLLARPDHRKRNGNIGISASGPTWMATSCDPPGWWTVACSTTGRLIIPSQPF